MSKINETNYPRRTQANYEDTDMFVIQKAGGNTYTTRIEDLREALSIPFVNCSTARNVNAKKVTVDGFTLRQGSRILVRFTNTGSSNPSSGNLTLEVNSTGAKTIVDGHTNKTALTYSSASLFYNNYVAEFVYDGTYWVYVNRDNNTTYTGGSLKTSTAKTGTAQSNITNTIAASTTMDNAIGTLLNNDVTLSRTLSDKTNQNALAKVENGATASQSYAIGEHFMRDGAFCTAIAAITSGGSFTLNTNYKVDDVANNLEQLNSDLSNKLTIASSYRIKGRIVCYSGSSSGCRSSEIPLLAILRQSGKTITNVTIYEFSVSDMGDLTSKASFDYTYSTIGVTGSSGFVIHDAYLANYDVSFNVS